MRPWTNKLNLAATHRGMVAAAFLGAGVAIAADVLAQPRAPLGPAGRQAHYQLESKIAAPESVVNKFTISLGPLEKVGEEFHQWLGLEATKINGDQFRIWLLSAGFPQATMETERRAIARYILQEGSAQPQEFRNRTDGRAV